MTKHLFALCVFLAAPFTLTAAPTVHVEPTNLNGPRVLEEQTQKGVIRDYLEAWQSFSAAFSQNRADLLDPAFVGTASTKLIDTIHQQTSLGIVTHYQDLSHDLKIVAYSPEGLSVELVDTVEYDLQIVDHDKPLSTQRIKTRYTVVLTPAEVRWRVRIFQSQPE